MLGPITMSSGHCFADASHQGNRHDLGDESTLFARDVECNKLKCGLSGRAVFAWMSLVFTDQQAGFETC